MAVMTFDDLLRLTQAGAAAEQLVEWHPNAWRRRSANQGLDWERVLDDLEARSSPRTTATLLVSRRAVHDLAARCPQDFTPSELLVACCIWGFGRHPRARARVQAMLSHDQTDPVLKNILEASRTRARDGFCALFDNGSPRVPGLGIAFGTKFVHFAANHRPDPEPLIYDRFVADALRQLVSSEFPRADRYLSADAYMRYVDLVATKATDGRSPEDVEFALFRHGRTLAGPGASGRG